MNRQKHLRSVRALAALLALPVASYAQTTGFEQTGAGPFDYNDVTNWVGDTINGVWDSSLTLTAAQTATFGTNTTAGTGLDFRYDGGQNVTLRSDGTGPYTLTLGGDINVATVSGNRTITIGSATANQALNVDLGGATRTFKVGALTGTDATRTLTVNNNVTNGGLVLNGGGTVNFSGATNTLTSLRVQNSALRLNGNGSAAASTTVSGALTIDGAASSIASNPDQLGGIATITLTPSGSQNTALSASGLVRENGGVVLFRGNNLGGALGANGVSNITFTTAPTLVGGGGAAGTKNISIVNWALGATSAGAGANTFVTYDAVNGIRPLDTATEFENYAADYNGAVTGTDLNTRIATGTVTFTGNNTVNSLIMGETGVSVLNGDGGTLTVTSGAVYVNRNSSAISLNLNFGEQEGILGLGQPSGVIISGGIAGSGGLTVYQSSPHTSQFSNGNSVTFTSAATFTGDLTINSRAQINHSDFLAHGSRSGDIIVNGLLTLNGMGSGAGYTMNGLYGNGRLAKGSSGSGLFIIGDNDSDGNFTGIITDGGSTIVRKIGNGTQIFAGANAYNNATQILGGTLEVTQLANGLLNSGIGKSSNASTNLILDGGALKYTGAATSTDRLFRVGQTTTGATGTLNASGTGAVSFTNTGAITYGTAGSTGTPQTRTLILTGTNTGANTLSALIGNNGSATNGNSDVSVVKSGTGSWTLTNANTYRGSTLVSAGSLFIANTTGSATGTGAVVVSSGASFGGTGISTGLVTASAADSTFIGGGVGSIGTLNMTGGFLASSGATFSFEVNGASVDTINFGAGAVSMGGVATFDFTSLGSVQTGSAYTLFAGNGDWSSVSSTYTINAPTGYVLDSSFGTGGYLFDAGSHTMQVQFAAVPEPSTFALLGGAAALLLAGSRRRRASGAV